MACGLADWVSERYPCGPTVGIGIDLHFELISADQIMTEPTTNPALEPTRLPILKMAGLSVLACTMIGIGGGSIASMRGGEMTDGLVAIAVMFPCVIMTLMGLNILPSRPAGMWGVPVLAGTMFRAGMVAFIGFGVYLTLEPTKEPFVLTLLVSLLVTLAVDVLSLMSLIRSTETHSEGQASGMLASEGQA